MGINIFRRNPQSLGEGLQRVKNSLKVSGENLSTTPGKRVYNSADGTRRVNFYSEGDRFNSCLSVDTQKNNHNDKSLIGKLSGFVRTYKQENVMNDDNFARGLEKRTAKDVFFKDGNGKVFSGMPAGVKTNYKLATTPVPISMLK